jgi:hypothetical protein
VTNRRGQVFFMTVLILVTLTAILPLLINLAQNEAKWSVKEQKNTRAFHMAELGIERGYQQLILTTTTWAAVSSGAVVAGYNFDTTYVDSAGSGEYQVRLSSGVGTSIYITAVGRDQARQEVRGVKALYAGSGNLTYSIYSNDQISIGGSGNVEWAPVLSYNTISTGGRPHPRFYSTANITPNDANGSTPPNTDNIQWWSYYSNMPGMPSVDLNYYKGVAQAAGASPAGCGSTYYSTGNIQFKGCVGGGGVPRSGTWYTTGNATFKAGSGGNAIDGVVIALGNFEIDGNGGASRNMTVSVPPMAWKEYGNDWAYYRSTFDGAAPATYAAAQAASYTSTAVKTINNILINGLMYAGANLQLTGSGNSAFYGVAVVQDQPSIGSNVTFYFNPTTGASAHLSSNQIQRVSWEDVLCAWDPSGNAVCP